MKKLLASQRYQRYTAITSRSIDRKKIYALAMSTLLVLVVVGEGIRLALFNG